jgi:hypothetical protein
MVTSQPITDGQVLLLFGTIFAALVFFGLWIEPKLERFKTRRDSWLEYGFDPAVADAPPKQDVNGALAHSIATEKTQELPLVSNVLLKQEGEILSHRLGQHLYGHATML